MSVTLPAKIPGGPVVTIESPCRIVLIGANGAGKTRFGIWLEDNNHARMTVHRISAQKALTIPEFAPVVNLQQAERDLLWGRHDQHASVGRKFHDRWGGNPATFLLSDYEKLLALLFARNLERDRVHTEKTRQTGQYVPVVDSPIDLIVKSWAYLMPQRTVSFHDGKVVAGKGTPNEYHAKEMSDGERVALYLLAQCLCAPTGSMLIIDEPELHLHRSLMDKLWNRVEQLCPDKTLVYITHDLDFAASRAGARKIWIQTYTGVTWTWLDIPSAEGLPEALILEIVGNRKPLLFCEGDRGGLDHTIYQLCFPHLHVVPRGGSEKVIESTRALQCSGELHTFAAHGIIDRDVRSDREVATLEGQGIHVLRFAEIENLLCGEELLALVATRVSRDPVATVAAVTLYVKDALREELDAQVAIRAERHIRYHLSRYVAPSSDEPGLQQGLNLLLAALDIPATVADARRTFLEAIASGQLNEMLKVYNRKSIVERISICFGLKHGEYPAMVLRLLMGPDSGTFAKPLLDLLPNL